MGSVTETGELRQGYKVESAVWDRSFNYYVITLKDISYDVSRYVTIVSGREEHKTYTYDSFNGKLVVVVNLRGAERIQGGFSFVVYKAP
ncbi:MAG: hypothetical protein HYX90_11400 [Chloroflexi bacterium]|nr:hypothetical protein [Chloroflexota bacterium]